MKRGPKPTPTGTLELRGSRRAGERKDEPQTLGEIVKPPFVKGRAAKKFLELVEEFKKMNIGGAIDATPLARYCQLWALEQDLIKDIEKEGFTETCTNKNGDDYLAQRPQVNALIKIAGLLTRLEDCFGMSPAARTTIKTNSKAPQMSELERLLAAKAKKKGIRIAG